MVRMKCLLMNFCFLQESSYLKDSELELYNLDLLLQTVISLVRLTSLTWASNVLFKKKK